MKNVPQSKSEPLLFDELLSRCLGETDFAHRILQDFLISCSPILDEIKTETVASERSGVAQKVHRLKGTAATVGAKPFQDSLIELESVLRACGEDVDLATELADALNVCSSEFETVRNYIENELLVR